MFAAEQHELPKRRINACKHVPIGDICMLALHLLNPLLTPSHQLAIHLNTPCDASHIQHETGCQTSTTVVNTRTTVTCCADASEPRYSHWLVNMLHNLHTLACNHTMTICQKSQDNRYCHSYGCGRNNQDEPNCSSHILVTSSAHI